MLVGVANHVHSNVQRGCGAVFTVEWANHYYLLGIGYHDRNYGSFALVISPYGSGTVWTDGNNSTASQISQAAL